MWDNVICINANRMMTSFGRAACVFIVLSAVGLQAATYYVAKTGNNAFPGTADQPFLTAQKALNESQAGDIIRVGAGTYSEDLVTIRSGTSNAPIVFDGQGVATVRSVLISHKYIEFRNSTVAGKASGWWLFLERGGHHCVISNNVFDGAFNRNLDRMLRWNNPEVDHLPFGTNVASDVLVVSNTFKNASGSTVIEMFGDRNIAHGNRLIDGDSVDWFHVWGRSNYISGNLCSNSFVSGFDNNHPDFFQSFGLNGAGAKGIIIENNIVVASHGDSQLCMLEGQDCPDLRDFTFRNNLFVGVSSKGTVACNDVQWLNNTFVDCSTNPVTAGPVLIFTTAVSATFTNAVINSGNGGKVLNNVFLNCGGSATDRGWYIFDVGLTNIRADYNFVAKNNFQPVVVDSMHRSIGGLDGWAKFAWWEPRGINGGKPLFVDVLGLDYRPMQGSLLRGAALPLDTAFTKDFRGVARGAQWDIGAFQGGEPFALPGAPTNARLVQ